VQTCAQVDMVNEKLAVDLRAQRLTFPLLEPPPYRLRRRDGVRPTDGKDLMKIGRTLTALALTALSLSGAGFTTPGLAQGSEFRLPDACTAASAAGGMDHSTMDHSAMDHSAMGHGAHGAHRAEDEPETGAASDNMMGMGAIDLDTMPRHVQENMRKMMVTMPAMHEGMMNTDADVAFACGMIAHHQGAIDMAEVLLEHGQDAQMRALAEEIIAAQVAEIEEMTTWLAENAR
jgi:uncharacterized protein (DUF305 family)